MALPATMDRAAPGAVCTHAGKKLSNSVSATAQRPALVSVADAQAREVIDEAVAFPVSLSRAASGTVTVDFATADGTAKAREDYTATSDTLTLAKGEREKTVSVPVLDDGHDGGEETFTLNLANAQGARGRRSGARRCRRGAARPPRAASTRRRRRAATPSGCRAGSRGPTRRRARKRGA